MGTVRPPTILPQMARREGGILGSEVGLDGAVGTPDLVLGIGKGWGRESGDSLFNDCFELGDWDGLGS